MTRIIGILDIARDYILQFTVTHTLVSTVTSSLTLLVSGFQWRAFTFLRVPELSRPQLAASNSNSSQGLNRSSPLTHSLQKLITSRQGPHRKHHWFVAVYGCCLVTAVV
jgi:hypothetical protein